MKPIGAIDLMRLQYHNSYFEESAVNLELVEVYTNTITI